MCHMDMVVSENTESILEVEVMLVVNIITGLISTNTIQVISESWE